MLSIKDLVFKEIPVKKLVDQYVSLYIINKVISTNMAKLQLPTLMRTHPVANVSWVVRYREQLEEQKLKEVKLIEVSGQYWIKEK